MMSRGKEDLCGLLASLFSPPDRELARQIGRGLVHSFLQKWVSSWEGPSHLLKGFCMGGEGDAILDNLKDGYERLFSYLKKENISLIESFYKSWTRDPHCALSFSTEKGLVMGDSAVHLLEVYRQCAIDLPDEFKSCPDHLVLEMEFLSYLYRWATDAQIKTFIEDHLDWVSLLGEEIRRFEPHPFYVSAFEVFDLFLKTEKKRLEMGGNGKKIVH